MNKKGQTTAPSLVSHIFLWIIILGIGAWLVYSATHSNTENNKYAPGATINDNHSTRWPLTIDFNFSCSRQGLEDKWGKANVSTNTQVNH